MTFIGKAFVMVNLAISVMMMAVATGLFMTGIDRTEKAAKPGEPAGLTAQRKTELKELQSMIPPVENGWRQAHTDLLTREGYRVADQKWFQKELEHVRFHAKVDDKVNNPARTIELNENAQPVLDVDNPDLEMKRRPKRVAAVDRRNNPLSSIAFYTSELKKAQEKNVGVLAKLDKAFQEDIRLTNLLVPPIGKGLRDRSVDERLKREGINFEYDAVDRFFVKTRVESAILRDRIGAMDDQIKGLRRTLARLKSLDAGKSGR